MLCNVGILSKFLDTLLLNSLFALAADELEIRVLGQYMQALDINDREAGAQPNCKPL